MGQANCTFCSNNPDLVNCFSSGCDPSNAPSNCSICQSESTSCSQTACELTDYTICTSDDVTCDENGCESNCETQCPECSDCTVCAPSGDSNVSCDADGCSARSKYVVIEGEDKEVVHKHNFSFTLVSKGDMLCDGKVISDFNAEVDSETDPWSLTDCFDLCAEYHDCTHLNYLLNSDKDQSACLLFSSCENPNASDYDDVSLYKVYSRP